MFKLYLQAAFKKRATITADSLEALQRAPVLWQSFAPSPKQYARYCKLVNWENQSLVHPLYLQVKALPLQLKLLVHPKSPFALLGLVHIDNQVITYADVRVDIPCEMVARFSRVYQHRQGLAVAVQVSATQRGSRVYEATGTYLMRSRVKPGRLSEYPGYPSSPTTDAKIAERMTFAPDEVRRYAWLSGDLNPIHLSTITARMFGFKRAIAHGMFSGARVIAALDSRQTLTGATVSLVFKRPLMLPGSAALYAVRRAEQEAFFLQSADNSEHADVYLQGSILR